MSDDITGITAEEVSTDAARPFNLHEIPPVRVAAQDQPAREQNIQALVDFFESGIKESCSQVGIELEHTIVTKDDKAVSYRGEHGVEWILEMLSTSYPEKALDFEGDLLGVARPREAVTIEPAAQLELSAGPFDNLRDAFVCFTAFERNLSNILEPVGEKILTVGYHPTAKVSKLDLIPKRRYDLMNEYLGRVDTLGINMMRGSASTQVSIDYSSVEDCLRKLRLGFALVPILALITDNTPTFEGKRRPHKMMRTEIWMHTDNDRCGVIPGVMEPGFSLRDLAAYVLDTPAITVPCTPEQWCYSDHTFGEIYASYPMERSDVEHAVSMFFTDVRLKTYLEIRPADSMPVPYAIAYAALIKGLFYNAENLGALDEMFVGVTEDDITAAKYELMEKGYDGIVYGRPVGEIADKLVELAAHGLVGEVFYLEPLATLIDSRVTLADLAEKGIDPLDK